MIKKYRTLQEAEEDLPRFIRQMKRRIPLLVKRSGFRGIKKFKTIEEANLDRIESAGEVEKDSK